VMEAGRLKSLMSRCARSHRNSSIAIRSRSERRATIAWQLLTRLN
jgi:hypothetical protein